MIRSFGRTRASLVTSDAVRSAGCAAGAGWATAATVTAVAGSSASAAAPTRRMRIRDIFEFLAFVAYGVGLSR
jgi:hypothetical protein